MGNELRRADRELLERLAEYRLLTTTQIAVLGGIGNPAARKRAKKLQAAGLACPLTRLLTGQSGRPEEVVSLTATGARWVQEHGSLNRRVPLDRVCGEGIRCVAHLHLINWFRIHLVHMDGGLPDVSSTFLASTSPFLKRGPANRSYIGEVLAESSGETQATFTPDGVFQLRHGPSNKTLLFFLEVDRGTESLSGPAPHPRTIEGKLVNYRRLFQTGGYRRYEELWSCKLSGFRLLFLTHTAERLRSLCNLVQRFTPSDFVWLTDWQRLIHLGASADIWSRGGRVDEPPQSILGKTLSCSLPIPGLLQRFSRGAKTLPKQRTNGPKTDR